MVCGFHMTNFYCFLKCHNSSKEKAVNAARNLLLDSNITFQSANENPMSSSDDDEEQNNEDMEVGNVKIESSKTHSNELTSNEEENDQN